MPDDANNYYLLLLNVSNLDDENAINAAAKRIHGAYMELFGGARAFTAAFLRVAGRIPQPQNQAGGTASFAWQYVLAYAGPPASATWLESRIAQEAEGLGATVTIETYDASDRSHLM